MKLPDFNVKSITNSSPAAAGFVDWIIKIVKAREVLGEMSCNLMDVLTYEPGKEEAERNK